MIDQSTIERIYDAAQVADVIGDFVPLKRRGVNLLGCCPFHNEKTPSFTVSPAKGIYKCFGCGKGGNVVNFVMEHENLSYVDALKFLAKKYHIEIIEKEATPEEAALKNERESLLIVSEFAGNYFHDVLLNNPEGKSVGMAYFRERGVREDMIKKFHLGYSPENRSALSNEASAKGYKSEYLVKTGLVVEKDNYRFDRFAGRVIFPIHNISGNVIGFGGRTLKTDKQIAKYLNSPESEIYHKSRVLYGMHQAKKAIMQHDKCFLVEGYLDVISMHQAGIENVVASSGTSLTEDQIKLIHRFSNNLTILYDGDPAGIKAAIRGIDMVLEQGLNVKILLLPENEDPDSFVQKHGASEVISFIAKNESDFVLFKTKLLLEDAKHDPVKRAALISDIVNSISVIPNAIVRSEYVKECATLLHTDENLLFSEISSKRRKKYNEKAGITEATAEVQKVTLPQAKIEEKSKAELHEREIVRVLLNYGNNILVQEYNEDASEMLILTVAQYIITEIENDELEVQHPLYKQIFDEYSYLLKSNVEVEERVFINHTQHEISSLTADLLSKKYTLSKIFGRGSSAVLENEETKLQEFVPSIVNNFKNFKIMTLMQAKFMELEQAHKDNDIEKIEEIQTIIQQLNTIKKTFALNLGKRIIVH